MGWFNDIVDTISNAGQQVIDTVNHAANTALRNPVETAAVVVAAPYVYSAATAGEGLAAITSPTISDTVLLPNTVAPELTAAQASQMIAAEQAASESFLPSTLSARDVLTATNTGLNLATAGVKLAAVANTGKIMNAQQATANGLTGALGMSPIQTPSGLITTTPNGPIVAGTSVPAPTSTGMDQQTMMVIAGAVLGIFLLTKYAKG